MLPNLEVGRGPQTFSFISNRVNVECVIIQGEPWFVAYDICKALDYKNTTDIIKKILDNDEYLTYQIDRAGQKRNVNIVNESGLYHLIFKSDRENAVAFRRWVTNEVLPQIRKTGKYSKRKQKRVQMNEDELRLFQLIDRHLIIGDVKYVSETLGKPRRSVSAVKNRWYRNTEILQALVNKARENLEKGVQMSINYPEDLISKSIQSLDV